MADLLIYNIKVSILLLFFYIVYKLICSQSIFFRINRLCILLFYLSSLFIFLIRIEADTFEAQHVIAKYEVLLTTEVISVSQHQTPVIETAGDTPINWMNVIGVVYLTGVFFVLLRIIYSILYILSITKGCEKKKMDKATLILVDKIVPSFSWMKYIIISRKDYDENKDIILIHELSHIRNKHSLDLLISEFFLLFQWYNPIAWLFRRELRDVHEFEADDSVLKSGIDAKTYQFLLIKKAAGSQYLTFMTNSFNHSKLERRITMMLKNNNNPYARLKYLLLIPAFAIAVSLFARPELTSRIGGLSEVESTEKNVYLQNKLADPSDTIDLKEYRVEAFRNGERIDFNQWKNFERIDGYILVTTDSARYYRNGVQIAHTVGGTLNISEKNKKLSGETIQQKLIAACAMKFVRQSDMLKAAGGKDNFLNSIDLKKYRVESYLNGKRINFDEWKNFREKDGYIVIDIDSAIYYNGNKRIGQQKATPGPFQQNISKSTKNLNGETIQRILIASQLFQRGE